MDINLFLILDSTYAYTEEAMPEEDRAGYLLRTTIHTMICTYMQKQGYTYDTEQKRWVQRDSNEQ